jgi:drug/metabolite transporter (DMT)-like permease
MILLLSRAPWHPAYLIALIGFAIFVYDNYLLSHQLITTNESKESMENQEPFTKEQEVKQPSLEIFDLQKVAGSRHQNDLKTFRYGVVMILLSAFTEALIYFIIRRVKTTNHWDHLFISYFPGAVVMTIYMIFLWIKSRNQPENRKIEESMQNQNTQSGFNQRVLIALLLNGVIGSIGYVSRFFAAYRLEAKIYAILSYFGIIMAYVYGILLNKEQMTGLKILGTILIILANYLVLKK